MVRKYNRRKYKRRGYKTANQKASLALREVSKLKKATEKKVYDTATNDTDLARTGAIFDLLTPVQGDARDEQIGDKAALIKMRQKMLLSTVATAGTSRMGLVRVFIVRVKTRHSSDPVIGDFLTDTTVQSQWESDSNLQFQVVYDSIRSIYTPQGTSGAGPSQLLYDIPIKCKGVIFDYDSVSTYKTNAYYMGIVHSYEDEDVSVVGTNRVVYTDS